MTRVLFAFLILIFIIQSKVLILKNPPVWPDEAIYADIVDNFINEKKMAPNIWQEAYPGATEHFYSYPPVFFYLLAGWVKLFGFSILTLRVFSVVSSAIFAVVFFSFAKLFFRGKNAAFYALLPIIGLSFDHFFAQFYLLSRQF